jgi:electron transfer flavoprotein alpha subunit
LTDVNSISSNAGKIECSRNALGGATVAVQQIETKTKSSPSCPKPMKLRPKPRQFE